MNIITLPRPEDMPLYTGIPVDQTSPGFKFHYACGEWEVKSVNPPQFHEVNVMEVKADNLQGDPTEQSSPMDVYTDPNPSSGQAASGGYQPETRKITGPMVKKVEDLLRVVDPQHWVFPEQQTQGHPKGLFTNPPVVEGEPASVGAFCGSANMDDKARKVWSMLGIIAQAKRR